MNRKEARESGVKEYVGRLCKKHPQAGGRRRVASCICVQCDRDKSKSWAQKNKERVAQYKKSYGLENRVSIAAKRKEYMSNPAVRERYLERQREYSKRRCKEKERARNKKRRADPAYKAAALASKRAWRHANRERYLATSRAYDAKQIRENMQRRISKNLRHRIYKAMLGKTRGVSAVRDLGVSIEGFRLYMEQLFKPGMSWENYGEWHIDHIRPLAGFDLTIPDQAREACHYSNLQPLWAAENQAKWCKPHPEKWPANWAAAWLP